MNFKTLALTAVAAALCAQGAFAATAAFKVNGQTVTKAEQDEIIKMLVPELPSGRCTQDPNLS